MAMENRGLVLFGIVLALGFIITGGVVGRAFYRVKNLDNTISVTGSAQRVIDSDTVRWTANFNRTVGVEQLKDGSVQIKKDLDAVLNYLNKNGITKEQITINPVTVFTNSENNGYGSTGRITGYSLGQQIIIESTNVQNLTTIAQESTKLLNEGIVFSSQPLEYYYSKLDDVKIEMLGAATDNAKQRAVAIADKSGADLGSLKAASMGVFQITPINSTEVSDYGVFDTSAIKKRITAVVRTTFSVE